MKKSIFCNAFATLTFIFFVCLIGMYIISCRKIDRTISNSHLSSADKFLSLPSNASPSIKRIADFIKQQNDRYNFLDKIIKEQGIPVWGKSIYLGDRAAIRTSGGTQDTIVLIPLVQEHTNYVHSLLACKLDSDSVRIKLIDGGDYAAYKFTKATDTLSAEFVAYTMMHFDNIVFGHSTFRIKDSLLFAYSNFSNNSLNRYMTIKQADSGVYDRTNSGILLQYT